MRKVEERMALLHKVATLFYGEGKNKDQISKIINQSSTHVANLLKEAKEKGIVDIRINLPRLQVLQEKLRARFHHLREVVVVPNDADTRVLLRNLAQATAEYFENKAVDGVKVGVGGGYLMYQVVSLLPERLRDIHIYPGAIVGRGPTIVHIDPIVVATLLWAKSGHLPGRAHYVTVTPPGSARREVQKHYRELRKNQQVSELLDAMTQVDCLFASLGGLDAEEGYIAATQSLTRNLLDEMKFDDKEMRAEGVVGDIVYSFFDEDGNSKPTWDLVASLGVKSLRKMSAAPDKQVVLVVGSYKMQALKAALRGHLCNVLITDTKAAEALLSE